MCVALFSQHAKCMFRIMLSSVAYLAVPYFFILPHKRNGSRTKVTKRKICAVFYSKKNWARNYHKYSQTFMTQLPDFMFCWSCISVQLFNKNQLDAIFILSLFHQSTSTCFGHILAQHHEVYCIYTAIGTCCASAQHVHVGIQPGQQTVI